MASSTRVTDLLGDQPLPQIERSPLHYNPAHNLVLLASTTLYRIPEDVLCTDSVVLKEMLDDLRLTNPTVGRTDNNPFLLDINSDDMDRLLDYRFQLVHTHSFVGLVNILQTSIALQMKSVQRAVSRQISRHDMFQDAARQVRLGYVSDTLEWFRTGFEAIISSSLSDLSIESCETMGTTLLHQLIQSRAKVEEFYMKIIAKGARYERAAYCRRPLTCELGWRRFWDRTILPVLALGDGPEPVSPTTLEGYTNTMQPLICAPCLHLNIASFCSRRLIAIRRAVIERETELAALDLLQGAEDVSDGEEDGEVLEDEDEIQFEDEGEDELEDGDEMNSSVDSDGQDDDDDMTVTATS